MRKTFKILKQGKGREIAALSAAEESHFAVLRRRQKICPHLFLIKGVYNGLPKTSESTSPSFIPPFSNPFSKGSSTSDKDKKNISKVAVNEEPSPVEQQCEWCGLCRSLDPKTIESAYHRDRMFKSIYPEIKDEEEPWVDVSYNVHSALKALDMHVRGADDNSTSLVTKFLGSATEQVSRRAIYQQAELRQKLKQEAEVIAKKDAEEASKCPPNRDESAAGGQAKKSTGDPSSDELKEAVEELDDKGSRNKGPNVPNADEAECDYSYAAPSKAVITTETLYNFVPNFKNIVSGVPLTPYPHHVATIPQAMKYFTSASKREHLANYLVTAMEREFQLKTVDDKSGKNGLEKSDSPEPSTSLTSECIPQPSPEFITSALRAMKYCAVVYGTAYERHFFDSVLQVGRVRSFLEIYQSSFESNLAAARRMVSSDLGEMTTKNKNAVWNIERQKYLKHVPSVEILSGQWTNVPWGVTYVIAVDHTHKEITIAFRGTFADAGIVVDIHNGPLSVLTFEEEERLKVGPFADKQAFESTSGSSKTSSSAMDPTAHFTAPFGFIFNIKPGSPQTQSIDKEVLVLALLQYPQYKIVVTGHSLGAAYASNFMASRLLIGALAQQAGLYNDAIWGDIRQSILKCQAADKANGKKQRPSYNAKLADLMKQIDFSDPVAVAGLYVNGLIELKETPSPQNDSTRESFEYLYISSIETRISVNSFAPPPSANITWRNALAEHYPKLDFRSFVHDTDVIARLQVPALRTMQKTINEVVPSVLLRTVTSILSHVSKVANGEGSVEEQAEISKVLDQHVRSEIEKRRAIFATSTARIVQNVEIDTDDTTANIEDEGKEDEMSKMSRAKLAKLSEPSSSKSRSLIAQSPEEQLANLESLQTCFHDPSVPRSETRDNYWVQLGNIYLLAREGQSYHKSPKKLKWDELENVITSTTDQKIDGTKCNPEECSCIAEELFSPSHKHGGTSSSPQLLEIRDSSFDIATEFNSVRKSAQLALVKDPLSPTLFMPIIDMRSIHNHFLFRYGRAILDLGVK